MAGADPMLGLGAGLVASGGNASGKIDMSGGYNFNQPFSGNAAVAVPIPNASSSSEAIPDEYEMRVRKFLELTRDEENYEDKVRKFVEEAAKYRKDRKNTDEKSKKKEKKKSKKLKKDSKKKRKEKKSKSGKKDKDDLENMEFREALK